MSELDRIERVYGSVAEYNRVMSEEYEYDEFGNLVPREYTEPSEEEIQENQKILDDYRKFIDFLSGDASACAKKVSLDMSKTEPVKSTYANYNDYVYACHDWGYKRRIDIMQAMSTEYDVYFEEDVDIFELPKKFCSVSIEVTKHSQIHRCGFKSMFIDQALRVFNDLHYLNLYPTFVYNPESSDEKIVASNLSLGELRRNYLAGVDSFPSIEGLQSEYERHTKIKNAISAMNE